MLRLKILLSIILATVVLAITSTVSAMTWGFKDLYGDTQSNCVGIYYRAGYMSPVYWDGSLGTNCWVNATTSAWDSNLGTDYFKTEPGTGIQPSVITAVRWHDSVSSGVSYTVYSSTKCAGSAVAVPWGSTANTTGITDRSVSTALFVPSCQA